jgi:hypothetical protein
LRSSRLRLTALSFPCRRIYMSLMCTPWTISSYSCGPHPMLSSRLLISNIHLWLDFVIEIHLGQPNTSMLRETHLYDSPFVASTSNNNLFPTNKGPYIGKFDFLMSSFGLRLSELLITPKSPNTPSKTGRMLNGALSESIAHQTNPNFFSL